MLTSLGLSARSRYTTQADKATQLARYVHREGYSTADLVSKGHAMLPSWANDGAHFFAMADRYERKNATVARTYEIALPRELSPAGREALAADIRAAFFERYPSAWAIHNPIDGQGGVRDRDFAHGAPLALQHGT